jgi:hypothetical protein
MICVELVFVMAGLVPAISFKDALPYESEITGTSPVLTKLIRIFLEDRID